MTQPSFFSLLTPQQRYYGNMLPSIQGVSQRPVIEKLQGILADLNNGTNRLSHQKIKDIVASTTSEAKRSFPTSPLTDTINELALTILRTIRPELALPSGPPKLLTTISEERAASIAPPPLQTSASLK